MHLVDLQFNFKHQKQSFFLIDKTA